MSEPLPRGWYRSKVSGRKSHFFVYFAPYKYYSPVCREDWHAGKMIEPNDSNKCKGCLRKLAATPPTQWRG